MSRLHYLFANVSTVSRICALFKLLTPTLVSFPKSEIKKNNGVNWCGCLQVNPKHTHTHTHTHTRREREREREREDLQVVIVQIPFGAKHLLVARYRHRQPDVPVPTLSPLPLTLSPLPLTLSPSPLCLSPPLCLSHPCGQNWMSHISASNKDKALMFSSYERSLNALLEFYNLVAR